jgi:BirA family biotin operon repressor/biotin-[acetyl-CoA-carboxylase] ligase
VTGAILATRRQLVSPAGMPLPWRVRALPVCASTEWELDRWLALTIPATAAALKGPLGVLARRQRFGRGQQGRSWSSPPGGVWLSAALPWPEHAAGAASPALAVGVGLILQLETLGVAARLKWPNDLMLDGRKLAGLLPRLRLRHGRVRWARIGVGLNGCNRVPAGAVNLLERLGPVSSQPRRLAAHVLAGLDWAVGWSARPEEVRRLAEQCLRLPTAPLLLDGEEWEPIGLSLDGGLRLASGERRRVLRRSFAADMAGPLRGWRQPVA